MNKFSKYFVAFASLAVLASCSNDEPGNGGGENKPVADGEKSYLTITLRDANDMSRAGVAEDKEGNTNGDYQYSEGNEGTVSKARFFFFDEAGVYAGQTTSDELVNGGDEEYNIEFKAKSVIALNNIVTSGGQPTYPKYMVTLLNVPQTVYTNDELKNVSLADFSKDLTNTWGKNEMNGFVMASTSYLADDNDTNHSNTYYYATVLKPSDFAKSPELALANTQPVDVYVERLAVRVHVSTVSGTNMFDVKATTFGATGDNPDEAATNFKVRIDGWYLNGTQPQSYLLKQLDVTNWADIASVTDWDAVSKIGSAKTEGSMWQWNKASDARSFWGMSFGYGNISDLTYYAYDNDQNATYLSIGQKSYCNENTTTKGDLKVSSTVDRPDQQKLTSVIVKATVGQIVDGEFQPVDLIEHNGIYFTDDRFIAYVLDIVNTKDQLNFYTVTRTPSTEAEGEFNEDYKQVTAEDFEVAGTNDRVYVAATAALAGKDIYKKIGDENYVKYEGDDKTAALDELAGNLKAATSGSTNTRGFKDGKMYYNIPIVHLNEPTYETTTVGTEGNQQTVNSTIKNWLEGSFGVVRNHSYEVKINSVKHLGNGVFDPTGETIKPDSDPNKEYWWLGATINILSWKIVNNSVDL